MFPQIPNTIKKNLDEMERESLRLMNESFQLLIRRSVSLRIRSQTGLKETVITPLSQKLEKNITSLNYCMEYSPFSLSFPFRNEVKAEQQAEELTQSELHLIQFPLSPFFLSFFLSSAAISAFSTAKP